MQQRQKYSREDIRIKVDSLVDVAGVRDQYPVPLEDLVYHLGYELVEFDPDVDTDGISGAVSHDKKCIYLNADDSARRKVFTLAHEIGHVVLHGDSPAGFIDYRKSDTRNQKEWEADNFAGELLMPADHFKAQWRKHGQVPWRVAPEYGVSEAAAKVRAEILGLPVRDPFRELLNA